MSSITRVIPLAARLVLAQRQSRPKPRFFHWEPRYCTVHHTGRDGREWRESSHSRHLGDDTTGAPIAAVLAARLAAGAGTRPVLAPGCASPASSLPAPVSPRAPRADTRVCWGGHRQGDGRLGTWYWWRRSFHHPCGWTAHRCIVHRSGVTRRTVTSGPTLQPRDTSLGTRLGPPLHGRPTFSPLPSSCDRPQPPPLPSLVSRLSVPVDVVPACGARHAPRAVSPLPLTGLTTRQPCVTTASSRAPLRTPLRSALSALPPPP